MRLVARHEDDPRAGAEQRKHGVQGVHLRIPVELHGVVLRHSRLHAAGCVQHQDVEAAPLPLHRSDELRHRRRVGEVRADGEGRSARLPDGVGQLHGPRLLVAEVDDDARSGLGQVPGGVGADSTGGTGDERALPVEGTGRERVGHEYSSGWVDSRS